MFLGIHPVPHELQLYYETGSEYLAECSLLTSLKQNRNEEGNQELQYYKCDKISTGKMIQNPVTSMPIRFDNFVCLL